MQALILAGGKGTRLRPLTVYTPKPVVPVVNRPFLLYQIEVLRNAGITDITLSLSYQPDKIESVLGDGSEHGVNLRYVTEPSPLGTGGAYKFAADAIRTTTVVLNGDILTDVNISRMLECHAERSAEATIALTPVKDPAAYGLVITDAEGRVVQFLEKPKPEDIKKIEVNTINAGIYVLEPSILDVIPKNENRSFEYHVFPELLAARKAFFAYALENVYWRDIGSPASYLAAHMDFLHGKVGGFQIERHDADIATAASIDKRSIIGNGCIIKPNARIVNSVLGRGVHVEEKAVIENSVIWGHTRISASAEITDSVMARSCHIGRNATVSGAVLGDKALLPDYSKV
ncbi:MAG: NDP-sugar synthase [Pyrinomonadaceae bacterium]